MLQHRKRPSDIQRRHCKRLKAQFEYHQLREKYEDPEPSDSDGSDGDALVLRRLEQAEKRHKRLMSTRRRLSYGEKR